MVNPGKSKTIQVMSGTDEQANFKIPSEVVHLNRYDDSLKMKVTFCPSSEVYAAGNSLIQVKSS